MRFDEVVELALYHPDFGFYRSGGHAGRRGDFLTSPEVGPLFGAVVANALDAEWDRQGRPDTFTVVEAAAGPGTLARAILTAQPDCRDSLDYVAVETSERQRGSHPDGVRSVAEAPHRFDGVLLANELLDNLPFVPLRRRGGRWSAAHVAEIDGQLGVVWLALPDDSRLLARISGAGDERVSQVAAHVWLEDHLSRMSTGRAIVIDYMRRDGRDVGWRTFASHGRAGDPLEALGSKDITVDVDLAQLEGRDLASGARPADEVRDQAQWLRDHGIEALVEEGRAAWHAGAGVGDLAAVRMRSRVREAEALTEPTGLGGFTVAEWTIG